LVPQQKPFSAEKPLQRTEQLAPVQAAAGDATPEPSKKILGYDAITWQKILPLGFMFFCILFNYTILRDTKVGGGRLAPH
jgi:AAA family ATP:ADP antiporter